MKRLHVSHVCFYEVSISQGMLIKGSYASITDDILGYAVVNSVAFTCMLL